MKGLSDGEIMTRTRSITKDPSKREAEGSWSGNQV